MTAEDQPASILKLLIVEGVAVGLSDNPLGLTGASGEGCNQQEPDVNEIASDAEDENHNDAAPIALDATKPPVYSPESLSEILVLTGDSASNLQSPLRLISSISESDSNSFGSRPHSNIFAGGPISLGSFGKTLEITGLGQQPNPSSVVRALEETSLLGSSLERRPSTHINTLSLNSKPLPMIPFSESKPRAGSRFPPIALGPPQEEMELEDGDARHEILSGRNELNHSSLTREKKSPWRDRPMAPSPPFPYPPPPPIVLPFNNTKKRRRSPSDSSLKENFYSKATDKSPAHDSNSQSAYSSATSLTFHSDSEHYEETDSSTLPRYNSMTGMKKSHLPHPFGYKWNKRQIVTDVESPRSEAPSYLMSRSDTESSNSSHRRQHSQRTQGTYASLRTRDAYQGSASASAMFKPQPSSAVMQTYAIKEEINSSARLAVLRLEMSKQNLDYYIVPGVDVHGSELVAASDRRVEFMSGFTGFGEAIVSKTRAYIVTDSCYWNQAEQELDLSFWTIAKDDGPKDWAEWLIGRIKAARVGIDGRMLSYEKYTTINSKLNEVDSKLIFPPQNLVDIIWKDKPLKSKSPVYKQEIEYTGMDSRQKLEKVRDWIREQPPSRSPYAKGPPTPSQKNVATFISSLRCIAWVLNLRGQDIPYSSLFHAHLFIGLDKAIVFLDTNKVDDSIARYLRKIGVEQQEISDVWKFLRKREWGEGKIFLSPNISCSISLIITHFRYTIAPPFVEHMMAVKNKAEIDNLKRAYVKDGAALVQFLAWLETKMQDNYEITEWEASQRLTLFREKKRDFLGLACENMSASGPNAARPRYSPLKSTAQFIDRKTPYLIDSGGLYRDGACWTARTLHFGRPTPEQREAYTRALQGHIAVDTAIFPEGTTAQYFDVLATKSFWKDGLYNMHRTGHEFRPFRTIQGQSNIPLAPGHLVINEPGYHEHHAWGVRIGSALLVTQVRAKHVHDEAAWLGLKRLTCVPIQTRMVKESLLTKEEKAWIKEHNQGCLRKLSTYLEGDRRALDWLKREADPGLATRFVQMLKN